MERAINYFTDEELAERASRYFVLSEFNQKDHAACQAIYKRGLNHLLDHMKRDHEYQTDEELAEITSQYNKFVLFRKEQPKAFEKICRRGLLDKLCNHMKRSLRDDYTIEELAAIASDYDDCKEFREKEPSAYNAISKRRLLEELCGHMKRRGNLFRRKIYLFTFPSGYAYVGLTFDIEGRFRQHTVTDKTSPVYQYIQATGEKYEFTVLTDWLDKDVAAKKEEQFRKQYKADGWKMLNRARCGALGSPKTSYLETEILKMVSQYRYIRDFSKGSPKCYRYLRTHGLLEKYCATMKLKPTTLEERKEEAYEKYKSVIDNCRNRDELHKNHRKVYNWMVVHHLLDEFFPKPTTMPETDEERITMAKQCKNRGELYKKNFSLWYWLKKNGRLDEVFPDPLRAFTTEEKEKIAASCKNRHELQVRHNSIYVWLKKNGLLDKYFPR
jgi:predicted GIY-YIG superfamily endonuclease